MSDFIYKVVTTTTHPSLDKPQVTTSWKGTGNYLTPLTNQFGTWSSMERIKPFMQRQRESLARALREQGCEITSAGEDAREGKPLTGVKGESIISIEFIAVELVERRN